MSRAIWAVPCMVVTLLLFVQGCGPNFTARATVKGKVTLDGKNLTTGFVAFASKDGRNGSANIGEDGSYTMVDAPIGDVGITVTVPKPVKPMPGMPATGKAPKDGAMKGDGMKMTMPGGKIDPSKVVLIPDRYSSVESSGLTFSVQAGDNQHDIKLTK